MMFDTGTTDVYAMTTDHYNAPQTYISEPEPSLTRTSPYDEQIVRALLKSEYPQTSSDFIFVIDTQNDDTTSELEMVKQGFGFNRSQLAKILGASRPQLNKWLSGHIPTQDKINKKVHILKIFLEKNIASGDAPYFGKFAKRYVTSNMTLLDFLEQPELDNDQLVAAYRELVPAIASLRTKEPASSSNNTSDTLLPPC